jgi:hypothetical protein
MDVQLPKNQLVSSAHIVYIGLGCENDAERSDTVVLAMQYHRAEWEEGM